MKTKCLSETEARLLQENRHLNFKLAEVQRVVEQDGELGTLSLKGATEVLVRSRKALQTIRKIIDQVSDTEALERVREVLDAVK